MMSKLDPKNREEAFAHQIIDDASLLMKEALASDHKGFEQVLERIETIIAVYRSPKEKARVKDAIAETKERNKRLRKNYPQWVDAKHKKEEEGLEKFEKSSLLK